MKIDVEKCIGCELCHPYCPVGAIATKVLDGESVSEIDQDQCVECGTCYERSQICPVDAIYRPELKWPRTIRESFSNSNASHTSTKTQGRGTEEMKTNDVTGRYDFGVCGVALEFGRPGRNKMLEGVDIAGKGVVGVAIGYDQQPTGLGTFTTNVTIPEDTVPGYIIAIPVNAPSMSVKLTYPGGELWEWNSMNMHLID